MNNVYDFNTGELIETSSVFSGTPFQGADQIIEMLHQRGRQITDLAVVWTETDGSIKYSTSISPCITLLGMISFLEDRIIRDDE